MKRLFLIVSAAFMSITVSFAQRPIIPVDWDEIKAAVRENPQKVSELVQSLAAVQLDTALTYEDRILAFYGQSLISQDREAPLVDDLFKYYKEREFNEVLAKAEEILQINPLNIDALNIAYVSIMAMRKSGDESHSLEEGQTYYNRSMRLYNTIAKTGYGSAEYPFYVTKVSDEYNFMRHYLDLWEYNTQYLTEDCCDVFELGESSKYYDEPKIFFEASRPLEITLEKLMK